jgi:ABC-type sugar transport system permease subunit
MRSSASSTGNTPDLYTVVYYIYDKLGDGVKSVQYASAAAVILFLLILGLTIAQMQISKKRVYY